MAVSSRGRNGEEPGEWTWQDDDRVYEQMLPELMQKYDGRYVAMFRGEVVGVADSAREAARRGLNALGRGELLLVAKVGEPLPEPSESDFCIDAPREVVTE